ncbi:MAG: alpha/beta hydrolase [Anaerolineae bacterium]|nr:alpha/beta hydrolase [Anaerolineae bacterium]
MSAITVGGDIVHYEVLGRGRPVVLVHGWMGSWRYWIPIMQTLHLKYRVYALDLFGFGDSAKNAEKYTMDHQINLLTEFMSQLGLGKAVLIGHGLGAQVVAEFANQHRDMVHRMLIASAPLFDTGDLATRGQKILLTTQDFNAVKATVAAESNSNSGNRGGGNDVTVARREVSAEPLSDATIPNSRMIDRSRLEQAALARAEAEIIARKAAEKQPTPPPASANPLRPNLDNPLYGRIGKLNSETLLIKCFKKTEPEYAKLSQDVARQDDAVLTKMTGTFDPGKLLDILRALPMPVVVVHGVDDPIIDAPNENVWTYLTTNKEDSLIPIPLSGVRHFPMLEAESFMRLVGSFLEVQDVSKLEVKERWRRRSR